MDLDYIPRLLEIARSPIDFAGIGAEAAKALKEAGEAPFPTNGCGAILSALLKAAGIDVPMTLGAGKLANRLGGTINGRKWDHIAVGEQQAGDVGVCFDMGGVSGADHLYLVIERIDADRMTIADNQATTLHERCASGKGGKTPTEYFLRAPPAAALVPRVHVEAPSLDELFALVAKSSVVKYQWKNRGSAPVSYLKGMAAAFGRARCRFLAGDPAAVEMAKADTGDGKRDALAWYSQTFADLGMRNDRSGEDTLRHLFTLMVGLGMRESSGRFCCGRDRSAKNTTANTAEAGLFQVSYNAHSASPLLDAIFSNYEGQTDFLEIFRGRIHCSVADLQNYGSGKGRDFQELSKACPAFAVEFAAVALRNLRTHWGPINTRKAEVLREVDKLLKDVATLIDDRGFCELLR